MKKNLCFTVLASILTMFAIVFTGCGEDDIEFNGSTDAIFPAVTSMTPSVTEPGATLMLKGTNLNTIAKIVFVGGASLTEGFTLNAANTELTIVIPEMAQDGKVKYFTSGGATAETDGELTFLKPTITSFSPESIASGSEFTITGTDLNLVVSVLIGESACEIIEEGRTATSLTVKSAADALTGYVIIVQKNGATVTSATEMVTTAKAAEKVIFEGERGLDWWGDATTVTVAVAEFDDFTGEATMNFEFISNAGAQVLFWAVTDDNGWLPLSGGASINLEGATNYSHTFSAEDVVKIKTSDDGLLIAGAPGVTTITKVVLILPIETGPKPIAWEGELDTKQWKESVNFEASQFTEPISIQIDFTLVPVDTTDPYWADNDYPSNSLSVSTGGNKFDPLLPEQDSWGGIPVLGKTSYKFNIDEEALTQIQATGLAIGGCGLIFSKISVIDYPVAVEGSN